MAGDCRWSLAVGRLYRLGGGKAGVASLRPGLYLPGIRQARPNCSHYPALPK